MCSRLVPWGLESLIYWVSIHGQPPFGGTLFLHLDQYRIIAPLLCRNWGGLESAHSLLAVTLSKRHERPIDILPHTRSSLYSLQPKYGTTDQTFHHFQSIYPRFFFRFPRENIIPLHKISTRLSLGVAWVQSSWPTSSPGTLTLTLHLLLMIFTISRWGHFHINFGLFWG